MVSDASASKRKTVRARLAAKKGTKLDLIRNCVIVLDLSKSMNDPDFRIEKYPNRGAVAIRNDSDNLYNVMTHNLLLISS